MNTIRIFGLVVMLLCGAATPVLGSSFVLNAWTDSGHYAPGTNMTIRGIVYSGTSLASATRVNLSTTANVSNTTTDTAGSFTGILVAPLTDGEHNITVSSGDVTVSIPVYISNVDEVYVYFVESFFVIPFTTNAGVSTDITGTTKEANDSARSGYYYVLVQDSAGDYTELYADTDAVINSSNAKYKSLGEGDSLKVNNDTLTIKYIDPAGSEIVIAKESSTIYNSSEGQNVLLLAVNSSGNPVVNESFDFALKNSTDGALLEGTFGSSNGNGTVNATITIPSGDGGYAFTLDGLKNSYMGFRVETFDVIAAVLDEENEPIFKVASGSAVTLSASAINKTSLAILESATGSASVSYEGSTDTVALNADASGALQGSYTLPNITGEFVVTFSINAGGSENIRTVAFKVVDYATDYDFELKAMAAGDKGVSDGFAPSQQGVALLSGKGSDGDFLNLTTILNRCNATNISVTGIFNTKGVNALVNTSYQIRRISQFLSTMGVGTEEANDIYAQAGQESCLIVFNAPPKAGVYTMQVQVKTPSNTYDLSAPVLVQDVFVKGSPTSQDGRSFVNSVSIGGDVYLGITAYDMVTGNKIDKSDIISASLIEVYDDDGNLVTEDMTNISFSTTADVAILQFKAADSIGGFHHVKFKTSVNVTRNNVETTVEVVGFGWFQEKLYSIWVYPTTDRRSKGSFGSTSTVSLTAEVRDAGGNSGEEGKTVTLDTVRYGVTGETLDLSDINSGQSASCDTDANGTCTLEFDAPDTGWDSGFYQIRVAVSDTSVADDGTESTMTDYGHGWFDVRNFYANAYVQGYEVSKEDDNITFITSAYDFSGNPLNATVKATRVMYMGTWSSWSPPTEVARNEISGLATGTILNGAGNLTLVNNNYIQKAGNYMVVLEVTSNGTTETTESWFMSKTFTLYVEQDWSETYATSDIVNITVRGYEKISSWGANGPNGTAKVMTDAWVQMVEREGQWGSPFKKRTDLDADNNRNAACSQNVCYLTFNLTDFTQGNYNLVIYGKDDQGNTVEGWYRLRVEVLGIRIPMKSVTNVRTSYRVTNATSFVVDDSCGDGTDVSIEPINVTSCKLEAVRLVNRTSYSQSLQLDREYNRTYFLLDTTNESNPALYVNRTCDANNNGQDSCSFNNTPRYIVGSTFTDIEGNNWKLINLDVATGTVTVHAVNAVIGYQDTDQSNAPHGRYLIKVDPTWSKSGIFYQSDSLRDRDWENIDLDGDTLTDWNEQYPALLADPTTANQYDVLYVSNSTDFAVNAKNSTTPAGIGFGGNPIYVINIRYKSGTSSQNGDSSGADKYEVAIHGDKAPDWFDSELGVFKPGSLIKVPIVVTSPSDRTNKIQNAVVNITSFAKFGMTGQEQILPIDPIEAVNTSSTGVAILTVNTTGIENGNYFLNIVVNYQGESVSSSDPWSNPRVQLRNFEVRGEIGSRGTITNFSEISESAGNLRVLSSEMLWNSTGTSMSPWYPDLKRGQWDYFHLYYNTTTQLLFFDPTPTTPLSDADIAASDMYNLSTGQVSINVTTPVRRMKIPAVARTSDGGNNIQFSYPALHHGESTYAGGTILPFRVFNYSNYVVYSYLSSLISHFAMDDSFNYVVVSDLAGNVLGNYTYGETIPLLDNLSVAKLFNWDDNVLLMNYRIGDKSVKLPRWWCDNTNEFYVKNFSEQSLNLRYEPEQGGPGNTYRNLTTTQYYMLLYDDGTNGNCDGVQSVNTAKMITSNSSTLDFNNFGPSTYFMRVGEQFGWPFILNSFDTNTLTANIFKQIWSLWIGENTTMWIGAREFNGQPVQGNATILSVKQRSWSKSGEVTTSIPLTGYSSIDTQGNAFVPLAMGNLTFGDYSIKIRVTSNVTGKSEIQEQQIFLMDPNMMMNGGGDGEDCPENEVCP